jgi:hypothetical protein
MPKGVASEKRCQHVDGAELGTERQGHSAKNDLSTEALRDFCTRGTFLWSVPGLQMVGSAKHGPVPYCSIPEWKGYVQWLVYSPKELKFGTNRGWRFPTQ